MAKHIYPYTYLFLYFCVQVMGDSNPNLRTGSGDGGEGEGAGAAKTTAVETVESLQKEVKILKSKLEEERNKLNDIPCE